MKARVVVFVGIASVAGLAAWSFGCGSKMDSLLVGSGDDASTADDASGSASSSGAPSGTPTGDGGSGQFTTGDAGASPVEDAGGGLCLIGNAGSGATTANPSLFGQIVYYLDGGALPAGMYRAKYVGGCMKYDFLLSWQIQAPAPSGWWFVGDTTDDRVVQPPASTATFSDFASCVSASLAVPAEDFAFDGGKLGIWLNDSPYEDNLAGDDGGNPTWSLQLLEKCPPNLGIEPR